MGPNEVKRRARALVKTFVGRMPGAKHDGVARQLATNFGLLYAGGNLGIEAQVLPWSMDHLQRALTRAFIDAIEGSKIVEPLAMGLDVLKAKLEVKILERKEGSTFGAKGRSGYWTCIDGGKAIVVHARQFGGWFHSKNQRNLVLDWLAAKGLFKCADAANPKVITAEDLKGVLRRWPDGSLVRSFEFSDPFPDKSLSRHQPRRNPKLRKKVPGKGGKVTSTRTPDWDTAIAEKREENMIHQEWLDAISSTKSVAGKKSSATIKVRTARQSG